MNSIKNYILLLLALFVIQSCTDNSKPSQTNILLIHADQLRIDCLGAYGNPDVETPNLDMLANDAVMFRNSFCPLPVCTPSRYSLISGMYVHEHQGWTNHSTLNMDIKTFPDVLLEAGYKTKAIGKMHFAPTYLNVGFEEMILSEQDGPGRWDDDYHRELMENNLVDELDLEDQRGEYRKNAPGEYWESLGSKATNLPDEFYSTDWISAKAMETIESWDESGNMLMIGYVKPHHPFDPPQKWIDMYDPAELEILPGWIEEPLDYDIDQHKGYFKNIELTEESLRKSMAYYYASITQIDYEVGRMIQLLKDKGQYDNTMIIFTSDHGEHLGYHHQILKGGFLYESIMKVPLIVKYPGGDHAGTVSEKLVSNVDIGPTILEVSGSATPETMTGQSLKDASFSREYVFAHNWLGAQGMARSHQYKLIQNRKGKSLFFDLDADPLEMNNLYDDSRYEEEIAAHLKALIAWQGADTLIGKNYLNNDAPSIDQPNVRLYNDGHREEIIEYYDKKMSEN